MQTEFKIDKDFDGYKEFLVQLRPKFSEMLFYFSIFFECSPEKEHSAKGKDDQNTRPAKCFLSSTE